MNQQFLREGQSAFQRLLDRYAIDDDSFKMVKDILSFGCMCGTALASPILFDLQNIWFIDVFVFFFSSAAFMLQHQQEIQTYGPFTLVAATFLGFAAYSSARTTLKELVPWLPLALALFVLLTVYFFPKLRQLFSRDSETLIAMEEGQGYPLYGTPVEPGSVQSDEDIRSRQRSLEVDRWLEYDISHVGGIGRPASRHSGRLSTRESDIDLDDSQSVARLVAQRMVSPSRQTYNISNLPRTALESGFSTQRPTAMAPPSQLNQPRDYQQRSLSPESIVVEGPSSTSAESERPLLG